MTFERTSAELVKNTSLVSGATVKDALDVLSAASPATVLTTLGDLLSYNAGPVRVPVGAADTFLGSTGAAVPSWRTAAQVLASLNIDTSSYTPTHTLTTNIAASTAYLSPYVRIDNYVGGVLVADIDPTAGGGTASVMGVSLPIASDFTLFNQAIGVMTQGNIAETGELIADTVNNRLTLNFAAQTTANHRVVGWYLYVIL